MSVIGRRGSDSSLPAQPTRSFREKWKKLAPVFFLKKRGKGDCFIPAIAAASDILIVPERLSDDVRNDIMHDTERLLIEGGRIVGEARIFFSGARASKSTSSKNSARR